MTYFILTGEPSGDKLGGMIARGLIDLGHLVSCWGSKHLRESGAEILHDMSNQGWMGWSDVIRQLPRQIGLLRKAKADIRRCNPDKIILIDYGSFNLRIATWAKKQGYHVIYYSPPKVWASRPSRIKQLQVCDEVIVLFPFEQSYYTDHGLATKYFGHPFAIDIISHVDDDTFRSRNSLSTDPLLGIFPGSRKSEIIHTLPAYLDAVNQLPQYQVAISCSQGVKSYISDILDDHTSTSRPILIFKEDYHDLLSQCDIALITSGTASWEAALHGTPQVVGYKTSRLNYEIARRLITTPFISLVNLIAGHQIVEELIQGELTGHNLSQNIIRLQSDIAESVTSLAYDDIKSISHDTQILKNTLAAITA